MQWVSAEARAVPGCGLARAVGRAGLALGVCAAGWIGGGCGLLSGDITLPSPEEVGGAKLDQAAEWKLLDRAARYYREQGTEALDEIRALAEENQDSLRLAVLLQDVERDLDGYGKVWNRYLLHFRDHPTARTAYLAARVAPDRESMLALVDRALELDSDLVPAQVMKLGLTARLGDASVLDQLADLLDDHPGSAEAWRLLEAIAPLYNRRDLELAAVRLEPWSPSEDPQDAWLLRATGVLAGGDPQGALQILGRLPPQDRDAQLLRAAAHLEAGRTAESRSILEGLVSANPRDAQAQFDLGLLQLDYLKDPGAARQHFEAFQELARAGAEVPYLRELQAEIWLREMDDSVANRPLLLDEPDADRRLDQQSESEAESASDSEPQSAPDSASEPQGQD